MTLPMAALHFLRSVPGPRQVLSDDVRLDLAGRWQFPRVVWTRDVVAMIAEDDDHVRGLVKRHCL